MSWNRLLRPHLDRLFQAALLLTANSCQAEAALIKAIERFDFSDPPVPDAIETIEQEVLFHSIQAARLPALPLTACTRAMVQPGLWPVLLLPSNQRASFVLIAILRYGPHFAACLLETAECTVGLWLHAAALALRDLPPAGTHHTFEEQWEHPKE